MKRLKIRTRITLWYAVFSIMFAVLISSALFGALDRLETNETKVRLLEATSNTAELVEDASKDRIYKKSIKYYSDGVYLSIYGENGDLIVGKRPIQLINLPDFNDENYTMIKDADQNQWFVYDNRAEIKDETVWIRTISKGYRDSYLYSSELKFFMFIIPLMIAVSLIGGHIITSRAFKPVMKIINTAKSIEADSDFSRRISVYENGDEINELSETINQMLDRLKGTFDKEKQFTSDVSHELRTPLAVIVSQSQYALEDMEYREKALTTINNEARRMADTVNKLLMLSRSDAGRLTIEKEVIDLSELCEIIGEQQKELLLDRGMDLEYEVEEGIKTLGDEALIIRMILNLLDNGAKYAGPGKIWLTLKKCQGYAFCHIADEGPGVPKEFRESIWERFFCVDKSRSNDESTGLGLPMVKALAKVHGGDAYLEDSDEGGACFTIKLPIIDEDED